jgi:hypothetical protein
MEGPNIDQKGLCQVITASQFLCYIINQSIRSGHLDGSRQDVDMSSPMFLASSKLFLKRCTRILSFIGTLKAQPLQFELTHALSTKKGAIRSLPKAILPPVFVCRQQACPNSSGSESPSKSTSLDQATPAPACGGRLHAAEKTEQQGLHSAIRKVVRLLVCQSLGLNRQPLLPKCTCPGILIRFDIHLTSLRYAKSINGRRDCKAISVV